jgi:hypothetical protein
MQFILYMKHANVFMYNTFVWNWSKNAICYDTIFIASCINDAIIDEILMAHNIRVGCVGHKFIGILGLHWAHWWHVHQDSQTLEWWV